MAEDKDMTTRPSGRKDPQEPMRKSGTARQPKHVEDEPPGAASGDPSE